MKSMVYKSNFSDCAFKGRNELRHWQKRKESIVSLFRAEKKCFFSSPLAEERVSQFDETTNALLTFIIKKENEHASYLKDMLLRADSFRGLKVADIGSGPFPTFF